MATKRNRTGISIKVTQEYRVALPKFVPSASLDFIDIQKLEKRKKATIDFGHFESGCCKAGVTAELEYGKIKVFHTERCKTSGKPSKAFTSTVTAAYKKLIKGRNVIKVGTPLSEIIRSSALKLPDIIISGWCIMICWEGSDGREHCFFCCLTPTPFCMGPSELQIGL